MKQTLQLRLGQQLTMTPQLQQAIKLLQLSSLDLQQEIQQVLDSNMMLETAEDEVMTGAEGVDLSEPLAQPEEGVFGELPNLDLEQVIPRELPVDSSWDEVYDNLAGYTGLSGSVTGDGED
ncbi:RNA polymerase factor sigma-54, partial [Candidatus Woesearchaeota archaeon]|nr:RNA polymerase factor sigma-54 [Candidatus Woesearchaeota archaeon]